ncbi:hypothetical protein CS006_06680 [Bifidobacterium primatium]|uniref:Uncharacterized protein n=1 Tax=Bifidobacterium primatium TaxID=2045438 RepID=A0A2M9H804_9BIFI|nr:hypothetical protein CS006_06680 [Bifidobacterium primatium]
MVHLSEKTGLKAETKDALPRPAYCNDAVSSLQPAETLCFYGLPDHVESPSVMRMNALLILKDEAL